MHMQPAAVCIHNGTSLSPPPLFNDIPFDMLFVTPNHLTQSIKETSGKSPKELITQRRLIEAKTLLLNSNNTVAEISYLLNFSEPTHFTKFFKKETSFTPVEYRLMNN